jgi:hypothetical protein
VAQDVQIRSCPAAATSPTIEQVQVGMRTARNRGFLGRITKDALQDFLPLWVKSSPSETTRNRGPRYRELLFHTADARIDGSFPQALTDQKPRQAAFAFPV